MKKDLGIKPYIVPMPILMIATYDEKDNVDVMNMAWGGICANNMVSLNISENHKTSANIKLKGAFTIGIPDVTHIEAAAFFGIASANTMKDKFECSGLTAYKSEKVDAPIIEEFPITIECKVVEDKMEVYGHHILGEIVGVLADESVLEDDDSVNPLKVDPILGEPFQGGYHRMGEKVGQAWHTGKSLLKK